MEVEKQKPDTEKIAAALGITKDQVELIEALYKNATKEVDEPLCLRAIQSFDNLIYVIVQYHAFTCPPENRGTETGQILWPIIKTFYHRGVDIDLPHVETGKTPLILACEYADVELVKKLLAHHASLGTKDKKGKTASDYAKASGDAAFEKFMKVYVKHHRAQSIDVPKEKQLQFQIPKDIKLEVTKTVGDAIYKDFVKQALEALYHDVLEYKAKQAQDTFQRCPESERTYNIISIDGGGVRAYMAAVLIERLWLTVPGFLNRVDLIVGSSGGATITAGLGLGQSPSYVRRWFKDGATLAFSRKKSGLTSAKYSRHFMKLGYYINAGNKTFKDLDRKILIPAWKLEADDKHPVGPCVHHNLNDHKSSNRDDSVVDAILRSSAAPMYFSSYQGFIDAGVFANNPLNYTLPIVTGKGEGTLGIPLQKVRVLSFGCGDSYNYKMKFSEDNDPDKDWGLIQWLPKFVSLLFAGQGKATDRSCEYLLGKSYLRVNPNLDNAIEMDDYTAFTQIGATAEKHDLEPIIKWINENFK